MNASRTATGPSRWLLCLVLMLSFFLTATASAEQALIEERISQFFPQVTAISEPEGEYGIRTLADGVGTVYGYAFESINVLKDRKSTRLNSSHVRISYAVFCLKKKKNT